MQTMPVCRGYQCTSTDLIKAHIIPACFAREIMGSHRHNLKISLDKVHGCVPPSGVGAVGK
jgi:hypothetical protein